VECETPGNAKPNVVVRIGRRIVQIQRECSGIRRIVPIAAADEATAYICATQTQHTVYGPFLLSPSVVGLIALINPLA
jgi:hypothetical protein